MTAFIYVYIMAKKGKKIRAMKEKVEAGKKYGLDEAIQLVKDVSYAKF
jgi:ribosomal protein L1